MQSIEQIIACLNPLEPPPGVNIFADKIFLIFNILNREYPPKASTTSKYLWWENIFDI